MGLQPSVNYTRERLVGNSVLPKLRELSAGELQHWTDRDLGNILDMAVKARIDQAEVWWEDDFAFGICINKVVRVDEDLPAVKLQEIYAVIRPCANVDAYGREEIIVAVINQKSYDLSIENGRWTEEKPEKSKYAHVDDEEEGMNVEEFGADYAEAHGVPDAIGESRPREGRRDGLVLIQHTINHNMKFATCSAEELLTVILRLITKEGADPTNIYVWRNSRRASITVELEK